MEERTAIVALTYRFSAFRDVRSTIASHLLPADFLLRFRLPYRDCRILASFGFCRKRSGFVFLVFTMLIAASGMSHAEIVRSPSLGSTSEYLVHQVSDLTFTFTSGSSLAIKSPQLLGDRLIFVAQSDHGSELFATDGSTVTEYDISPGESGSLPTWFHRWNDTLYFTARGPLGAELYSIDGGEPKLVADIFPGSEGSWPGSHSSFKVLSDHLYFFASDSSGLGLFRSNGYEVEFVARSESEAFFHSRRFGDSIIFVGTGDNGVELYRTDGNGVSLLADINPGLADSNPSPSFEFDGHLYFKAEGENGTELFKTDGNSVVEFDIRPGPADSSPIPRLVFNDELYFSADAGNGMGYELFKTDGSTVTQFDVYPGPNSSVPLAGYHAISGDFLYFVAEGPEGRELFRTDGESVKQFDLNPGPEDSSPLFFKTTGNAFYFRAEGPQGKELYKVLNDEVKLIDLNPGPATSNPQTSSLVQFADSIYVEAIGPSGVELFIIGDDVPTEIDLFPGSRGSYPEDFFEFNGDLFFTAVGPMGRAVYRTNGDIIEEVVNLWPKNFPSTPDRSISKFVPFGNSLLFLAQTPDGAHLFRLSPVPEPNSLLLMALALVATPSRKFSLLSTSKG